MNNYEKASGCLKFITFNCCLNMKDYKSTPQPQRYGYKQFTVGQW